MPLRPSRRDWPALLTELGDQLDRDRVYDRDPGELATAFGEVLQALERRSTPSVAIAPNLVVADVPRDRARDSSAVARKHAHQMADTDLTS